MHNFHSLQVETSKQGGFDDKLNLKSDKRIRFIFPFVILHQTVKVNVTYAGLTLLTLPEFKGHFSDG